MLTLNDQQLDFLRSRRDSEVADLDKLLSKLIEGRREGFGRVTYRLGWDTISLMASDQRAREIHGIIEMAEGTRENEATLATLRKWYTDKVLQFRRPQSSSATSNLEEATLNETYQWVLEQLDVLEHLADKEADEAN